MFKKYIFLFLTGTLLFSCNNDATTEATIEKEDQVNVDEKDDSPNVTIKGIVNNGGHATLKLEANTNQGSVLISETITDDKGNFNFDGKIKAMGLYQLRLDDGNMENQKAIPLTLVPGDEVNIDLDFDNFMNPVYSGTEWADAVTGYMQETMKFVDWQEKVVNTEGLTQEELIEMAIIQYQPFDVFTKNQIKESPANPANILLMTNLFPIFGYESYDEGNLEILRSIHKAYEQRYPGNPMTANVGSQIASLEQGLKEFNSYKIKVNAVAPEIELPNPDGKVMKLSSLRGNYVLIDFWAAWCKPCRMENPNVVRLYNKYKDKNFDIFSVSLDKEKENWVKAIEDDGLIWKNHVSDLKYWNTPLTQLYEFNAIPHTVFLDPDGKIIAKNLRGPSLEKKLQEIFGF